MRFLAKVRTLAGNDPNPAANFNGCSLWGTGFRDHIEVNVGKVPCDRIENGQTGSGLRLHHDEAIAGLDWAETRSAGSCAPEVGRTRCLNPPRSMAVWDRRERGRRPDHFIFRRWRETRSDLGPVDSSNSRGAGVLDVVRTVTGFTQDHDLSELGQGRDNLRPVLPPIGEFSDFKGRGPERPKCTRRWRRSSLTWRRIGRVERHRLDVSKVLLTGLACKQPGSASTRIGVFDEHVGASRKLTEQSSRRVRT